MSDDDFANFLKRFVVGFLATWSLLCLLAVVGLVLAFFV